MIDEINQDIAEQTEKAIQAEYSKNKTKATFMLADYLTQKYSIITVGEKEREMFVYRDGIYFNAENEIIFPEVQRILHDQTNKSAKLETFHKIADATAYPRSIFTSAPIHLIPLSNGVYDLRTHVLLPHDPKYRFTYKMAVSFNPNATCPNTLAFIEQVFTPEQIPTIQEWLGYYFYRLYMFKKAIIFVGEGDTGKTTFLEVITHLLGKENISSVSLQKMTSDRFSAAHLYEKHGNLVDELSAKDISDTGNFKIATGGGSISGEYKFGNQFSFLNFSKFTFACNKIPDVKDFDDLAYFNRWIVMPFTKTIEKKIPNFIATLTTEEERSGLFNWAMVGLERLLEQQAFSYGKSGMDTKMEMMRSGSSLAIFVSDRLVAEPNAEISKATMYDGYTAFCVSKGLSAETMDMFGKKFLFYATYASEGLIYDKDSMKGKRVRGWRNVSVIPSDDEIEVSNKVDEQFDAV